MATYRSAPLQPVDIVTYRHGDKLVYVKPAETYELALDIAQKEFEELAGVPRECIGFAVMSTFGKGERCPIRISESAWPGAVSRLMRGEIINVYIRGGASTSQQDLTLKSLSSSSSSSGHRRSASSNATGPKSREDGRRTPPPQYLEVPRVSFEGGSSSPSAGQLKKSASLGATRSQPSSRAVSPARTSKVENRRSWFGSIAK